jgi:hypothetical protein
MILLLVLSILGAGFAFRRAGMGLLESGSRLCGGCAGAAMLCGALGGTRAAMASAAVLVATPPMAVAQASGTQTDVVDACWTTTGEKIVETQTLNGPGRCNQLFPAGVPPEYVAGAPIALDIIKCHRKPIDSSDYKVPFTAAQRARLHVGHLLGGHRDTVCDGRMADAVQGGLKVRGGRSDSGAHPDAVSQCAGSRARRQLRRRLHEPTARSPRSRTAAPGLSRAARDVVCRLRFGKGDGRHMRRVE